MLLMTQGGGRGKKEHGVTSSCQRKTCSTSGFGASLRTVTERCLSPIGYRRTSRTLPYNDCGRYDSPVPSSHQQSHTLPAFLSTSAPTDDVGARQQPLIHQDVDDAAASRGVPWLECTHFGAEIRQIEPPTRHHPVEFDTTDMQATGLSANDLVCTNTGRTCSVISEDSTSRQTEYDEVDGEKEEGNPWILQQAFSHCITRRSLPNKTTKTEILRRCHSHDCTPTSLENWNEFSWSLPVNVTVQENLPRLDDGSPICPGGNRPLSLLGYDECHQKEEDNDDDVPIASFRLAREILHELEEELIESSEPPVSDAVLLRDCSVDQQPKTSEYDLQQPSRVADVKECVDWAGSPRCSNNWASPDSVTHTECGDQYTAAAESDLQHPSDAVDDSVPLQSSSGFPRCTQDWISPTSSDSATRTDCGDQQTKTSESDLQRPCFEDVNVHLQLSDFPRCSNDWTSPTSPDGVPLSDCGDQQTTATESDLQFPSDVDVTVPLEFSDSCQCSNDRASLTCQCHSIESQTFLQEETHEYNATYSTAETDMNAAGCSSLHDASADGESESLITANVEADTQATIVGTLKNMFAYFIAKLGGHERKDVQSEPHSQACRRGQRWAVGKNGSSLSTAAQLAKFLAAREKDGDIIGQRMALPRPFGTLDRVLSLVPRRAVRRRPRRRNTVGDVDLMYKLRRRPGDDDNDAGQSALVCHRPLSISISSIQDWILPGSNNYITATPSASSSSSSSSSSSLRSTFYERKMISDLEDADRTAETQVVEECARSVCASDFCDDDDDEPAFSDLTDAGT